MQYFYSQDVSDDNNVNVDYYYIPISKLEGWDGNVLWLEISEDKVKRNYERDIFPERTRYFLKDFSYQSAPPYFPQPVAVPQIPSKYQRPDYTGPHSPQTTHIHRRDLCNTSFRTEDELSNNITTENTPPITTSAAIVSCIVMTRVGNL